MVEFMQHNICLENVELFKTKCRICLQENLTKIPLFDSTPNYSDLVKEYTGLVIEYNKYLSNEICEDCVTNLMDLIKFVKNVKFSIEKFNNFLIIDASISDPELFNDFKSEAIDSPRSQDTSFSNDLQSDFPNSSETNFEEMKKLENELSFGLKFKKNSQRNFDTKTRINKLKLRNRISYKDKTIRELKNFKNVEKDIEKCLDYDSKYEIIQNDSDGKKYKLRCTDCGVITPNKSAFIIHYRKHSGERPYQCKICFRLFTQIGTLNAHIKKGHDRREKIKNTIQQKGLFICDICKKRYTLRSSLIIHLRIHDKDLQLQCFFCPQRFVKSGERTVHIRIHHTGERPYFCEKCGKTFAASTNLNSHILKHSDEKNFKCEYCEKLMKSHENLKRHILAAHTDVKEIICDYCGEAFALKNKLLRHIHIWHIKKEYGKCEICHENVKDLKMHIKCHIGDKPFGCTMCHKSFFKERNFIKHYVKHSVDEAKFKCPYDLCDSVFVKKNILDFHIMKCHIKQALFKCNKCPKEFYRRGDLGRHMVFKHNTWLLPIKKERKEKKRKKTV